MIVLVTGGAGFIGSHTCVLLLEAGHHVVVVDNLYNSQKESMNRVQKISPGKLDFFQIDVRDRKALTQIFKDYSIDAVIHFAGLKAVGESTQIPLKYYDNNVFGTIVLCEVMREHDCKNLIFSSSATVYGEPATVPITEDFPTSATNPYGRSKLMVEEILTDLQKSEPQFWSITLLRYFNPIGAHPSGLIGEDPNDIPNNLLPYITQVASGKLKELSIFGDDYDTHDGTGVRDYIHVMDLAEGHLCALNHLSQGNQGLNIFNLGTGTGYSVLDIVNKFKLVNEIPVAYKIAARRPGDIATCYADPSKAQNTLKWKCQYSLQDMLEHTWNWQKNNPNGYKN